jgi:hypothetical protein
MFVRANAVDAEPDRTSHGITTATDQVRVGGAQKATREVAAQAAGVAAGATLSSLPLRRQELSGGIRTLYLHTHTRRERTTPQKSRSSTTRQHSGWRRQLYPYG